MCTVSLVVRGSLRANDFRSNRAGRGIDLALNQGNHADGQDDGCGGKPDPFKRYQTPIIIPKGDKCGNTTRSH